MDAKELLEQLVASPDWEPYVYEAVDLGLFLGAIQTVQFLASNSGGRMGDVRAPDSRAAAAAPKAVRRRLRGKQPPRALRLNRRWLGTLWRPHEMYHPRPPHPCLESGHPNLGLYAFLSLVCGRCLCVLPVSTEISL